MSTTTVRDGVLPYNRVTNGEPMIRRVYSEPYGGATT